MLEYLSRIMLKLGYLPIDEVDRMLERIGRRLGQFDEPLAREYVLDPFPDGIEKRIRQMCDRRRTMYDRLAAHELRAQCARLPERS